MVNCEIYGESPALVKARCKFKLKIFLENVVAFRSAFTIMQAFQDTIDKPDPIKQNISRDAIVCCYIFF